MQKIIIIGGGIGGLCAAVVLQKKGYSVQLFEAASSLSPVGAGLGVGSNALTALYEAGIGEQINTLGNPLAKLDFFDSNDSLLNEMDLSILDHQYGLNSVTIHRAHLHDTFIQALTPGTIHLNKKSIDFVQDREKVTVYFEDGTKAEANMMIAADGIHSMFRQKLVPNSEARYAGYTCWRGVVHNPSYRHTENSATEIWGKAGRFGIVPLKNEQIYWFACVNASRQDPKLRRFQCEDLAQYFHSFPESVGSLIRETEEKALLHHDILDLKPLSQFVFDNIVLLGDAAHATTPNMGQGAGQAIEDAIVLANSLVNCANVKEALAQYEKKRVTRTKKIITMSRQIGIAAQFSHPFAIWLRNNIFKQVPASLLLKRFEYLLDVDLVRQSQS